MFRMIGVLLGFYVARCLVTGDVYARAGVWGRTFRRDEDGFRYWSAIGAYVVLVLMLVFLF